MIYITGDTHRDFKRFFETDIQFKEDDLVIILGDAGVNYELDRRDALLKKELSLLPCSFFMVRGNHEQRPENIASYKLKEVDGIVKGKAFVEMQYPKLIFATEGLYEIGGYRCFVSNGAYSVDKYLRLQRKLKWFPDEELTDEEMKETLKLAKKAGSVDFVLTHTCPERYFPFTSVIPGIDLKTLSKRMELFYDQLEEVLEYKKWYCGHYHLDREIGKMKFMYYGIETL